jgi:hypothetical protein
MTVSSGDIPRLVEIEFAAFKGEIVNQFLSYRDGNNPEHITRAVRTYKQCLEHPRLDAIPVRLMDQDYGSRECKPHPTSSTYKKATRVRRHCFRKIVDFQTAEIIAFVTSGLVEMDTEYDVLPLDFGHQFEPEVNRAWFALNEKIHRSYCGSRPHLCKISLFFSGTLTTRSVSRKNTNCYHRSKIVNTD